MLVLDGKSLQIEQLIKVARESEKVRLSESSKKAIKLARALVEKKLQSDEVIYGVTTGFGEFSRVKVSLSKVRDLQQNIIRSHVTGVGDFLPEEVVRAMMLLRINTLAHGHSGVRLKVVETFIEMLNKNILPLVPEKGSVGSSGDLAPLAHIALGLIGEGEVMFEGKRQLAEKVLAQAKIQPMKLEAKEGLALVNGTQLMTALGALVVYDAESLAKHADIVAAMSTDVMRGTIRHAHPGVHQLRPFVGQKLVAENIWKLMRKSKILESHKGCGQVQDAYSMRCVPQVHGASRDTIVYARQMVEIEMNSVTDNPLIFPEEDDILNGGNFHGQPVALVMDFLGIALAEYANIAERRIARLVDCHLSEGLPPFLVKNGGVNSGMMIAQYTAASLVSENKVLAHPASVDSIPTSANKEDHVSMGTIGARKCREILKNTVNVIAIELMCAAQALDFRRPLKSSKGLEVVFKVVRKSVPKLIKDRVLYYDIVKIQQLLERREVLRAVEKAVGVLN